MSNFLGSIASYSLPVLSASRAATKTLEPYQPIVAACSIAGKLMYRGHQLDKIKKNISTLDGRIALLSTFLKTVSSSNKSYPKERIERIEKRLNLLQTHRNTLKQTLENAKFNFWQLPSLLNPHPGLNPYNAAYQLASQSRSIKQKIPDKELTTRQKAFTIAMGTLSILGTAASLLTQIGLIDREIRPVQIALGLGLASTVVEGAVLAKEWIYSKLYPAPPIIAQ